MNNVAVILGAGSGSRMKSDKNKMLLEIMGKPVIQRSVEAFEELCEIDEIIVTCRKEELDEFIKLFENSKKVTFVIGGSTRQKSVENAVNTIDEANLIIIHDGARPFVRKEDIIKTIAQAKKHDAAAVGVPVKDTIKVINSEGFVASTPDRKTLFSIQTPQIFNFSLYKKALENSNGNDYTDDCQLIEAFGASVKMVEGDYSNIKITTPDDIAVAENIILQKLRRG